MSRELLITVGYLAGALTTLSFVPQVVKTLRCKAADELSYGWLFAFGVGVALWLVYGIFLGARPIIVANALTLALVFFILVLKVRYRKRKKCCRAEVGLRNRIRHMKLADKKTEIELAQAQSAEDMAAASELFQEYGASLGFSLCFQSFEQELAGLPGKYAPPEGRLLLARSAGQAVGCVALRPLEAGICEMKRLYVRPQLRGTGAGRILMEAVIAAAREIGYRRMRLDTVPSVMGRALEMYRARGFREIAPYTQNPVAGAIFLELEL